MRISTKRILSIGISLVLFIGVIVVYFQLIVPKAKDLSKKRAEIFSRQTVYNNQKEAVDQVQKLIAQIREEKIKELQKSVIFAMPIGPDTIGALRQIDAIAKSSNSVITGLNFRISPPANPSARSKKVTILKPMGVVNVSVSIRGAYENLKRFLELLEKNIRVANTATYRFTPGLAKDAGINDSMEVSVDVYYQGTQ